VSHLYSDASIGNNIKIWLVKLVDLGKDATVRIVCFKFYFNFLLFLFLGIYKI